MAGLRFIGIDAPKFNRQPRLNSSANSPYQYNWNQVAWQLGEPQRFPPVAIPAPAAKWSGVGILHAASPYAGAIVYWLEPLSNTKPAWDALREKYPKLARPVNWTYGAPKTPQFPILQPVAPMVPSAGGVTPPNIPRPVDDPGPALMYAGAVCVAAYILGGGGSAGDRPLFSTLP